MRSVVDESLPQNTVLRTAWLTTSDWCAEMKALCSSRDMRDRALRPWW